MFNKVLIANRGAIATRIIRTLRRMGVQSVAVYAEADAGSLHVRQADEAYSLGEGAAADTYLDQTKILNIARQTGAQAIHPGYGFLSENASFVDRCEAAGIAFVGPTPEQMNIFGLKHTARDIAEQNKVPLVPGTDLLNSLEQATQAADQIGYPIMLKSSAGGGGIGMKLCESEQDLIDSFDSVRKLGANNFSDDRVFLEKFIGQARHIEVQVFGDGKGKAVAIGERDCSSQRRNQKVIEECPAPNLSDTLRQAMHETAARLLAAVSYRGAGTVEYIFDAKDQKFYFLEVNTRLQVEHGVTEEVWGLDLVEWMLRLASAEPFDIDREFSDLTPEGHAIQVRLYAEDPVKNFQPSAGLLSEVKFADNQRNSQQVVRIDHWIESGLEVSPYFDPMLAKVITKGYNRSAAIDLLRDTLSTSKLYGIETNKEYVTELLGEPIFIDGEITTRYLNERGFSESRIDVINGGTQTTIQDYPGRSGYWHIGVPPSGPFDNYSFRLANKLLGNADDAAALEITVAGPSLQFGFACQCALTGAAINATLDGEPVASWEVFSVKAGQTLALGRVSEEGARAYLAVAGGIQCPDYLGSKSTFTLGQFGGHNGRALLAGDVLNCHSTATVAAAKIPDTLRPEIHNCWELRVIYGPHGAPDFFTGDDINTFFSTDWEVHYNSSRTGVRLNGPKPQWARTTGGEAGMHPSNIHDNAYAFGSVDFTGDMPVILGPDGPSLGGFVCPATVITADLWKLGQVRAGDKIRFIPVSIDTAVALETAQTESLARLEYVDTASARLHTDQLPSPVVATLPACDVGEDVNYRVAGDHFLLVEYGPLQLDIKLRFRAHALMQWLEQNPLPGVRELTPGIRSLQVHYDSQNVSLAELLEHLQRGEKYLATQIAELSVPSRVVHLPLSWDDEACREAIAKYEQSVRPGAPWCPSNLEFIRRINGLDNIEQVKDIVFNASYLVMGLGDVYLGAPVATPMDPRHRLVTTKYNPARTWTAENSVGIGGAYLCVYGMEGPGGYQFVGRTVQMWNRYRKTPEFDQRWLLRFFDQIRFYEVSADELKQMRRDFPRGQYPIKIETTEFSLADYEQFITDNQSDIDSFQAQRQNAFDEELERWHADGQFNFTPLEQIESESELDLAEGDTLVDSSVSGSIWQVNVEVGDTVEAGQTLVVLESMKMEINIPAPIGGKVKQILKTTGAGVKPGQTLVLLED
ncbi:urea carboxylase [Gilvimarinus sp. SDUM040013]|uniref:Urea carboxylase n=1 Tax=Gilvimarinus gilvus TaxID=3058038 RepID=A0ABU4RW01_9GAMM|nr:urea carboxylase [Gilvimarinus sp. SDUM040013]MDO3386728.1 urea carboxylase [Gilvimarinus sp. SDUM040013]MDX6848342.1 urea carboxylase [Gilvimarinus sp. SDUM040013]